MKNSMLYTLSTKDIKKIQIHFVVSTARTGSTLLSSMFNMHNNLLSPVEEPFAFNLYFKYHAIEQWTSKIIKEYCYDFYLFSEGVLEAQFGEREQLQQLLENHKEQLDYETVVKITYLCFFPERNKDSVTMIIDKQLKFHDFIEKVAIFFPKSKFIILTRDPRDNTLVKMNRIIREGSDKNVLDRKNNYYHLALDWNREYNLLYQKKKVIGEDRFMQLRYEDLVVQPEYELKRVSDFLGFKYDSEMLNYHETIKESAKKSLDLNNEAQRHFFELHKSLTEKVNSDKVDLWKKKLSKKDADIVWSICHERALQIGYLAENCSTKIPISLSYYIAIIKYFLFKIVLPGTYYAVPFFMRYAVKKIKYGNRFKSDQYATANGVSKNIN